MAMTSRADGIDPAYRIKIAVRVLVDDERADQQRFTLDRDKTESVNERTATNEP